MYAFFINDIAIGFLHNSFQSNDAGPFSSLYFPSNIPIAVTFVFAHNHFGHSSGSIFSILSSSSSIVEIQSLNLYLNKVL